MERFPLPRETPEAGVSQAAGLSEGCTLLSPCCSATLPCVNCKVFPVQPEHPAQKIIRGSGTSTRRARDSRTVAQDRSAGQEQREAPAVQSESLSKHTALYNRNREPKWGQRLEKPV